MANQPILKKIYSILSKKISFYKYFLLWNFNYYYYFAGKQKVKSNIPVKNAQVHEQVIKELKERGINVADFIIDIQDYKKYIKNAQYNKYPGYYDGGEGKSFIEKSLEHYLAAKLLNLSKDDVYIDIASADSPTAEIYHDLYGCKSYMQDILFPLGLHGNKIGSDAASMPVEDGFATKMALHCSFEHFEKEKDIGFIKEAYRVLGEGGKLCILPLYLFDKYAIQTDPAVLSGKNIPFEKDATLYCAKWYYNCHGRCYDVAHFADRIVKNKNNFKLTIYILQNTKDVDPYCYAKFIAVFEK